MSDGDPSEDVRAANVDSRTADQPFEYLTKRGHTTLTPPYSVFTTVRCRSGADQRAPLRVRHRTFEGEELNLQFDRGTATCSITPPSGANDTCRVLSVVI